VQLLYRTVLDFNVRIYRYLGPLKKVSVEISDLKRSKCLIKNVWYKFFEFESRKHISAARSVALIFAVTGFICRRGESAGATRSDCHLPKMTTRSDCHLSKMTKNSPLSRISGRA